MNKPRGDQFPGGIELPVEYGPPQTVRVGRAQPDTYQRYLQLREVCRTALRYAILVLIFACAGVLFGDSVGSVWLGLEIAGLAVMVELSWEDAWDRRRSRRWQKYLTRSEVYPQLAGVVLEISTWAQNTTPDDQGVWPDLRRPAGPESQAFNGALLSAQSVKVAVLVEEWRRAVHSFEGAVTRIRLLDPAPAIDDEIEQELRNAAAGRDAVLEACAALHERMSRELKEF